MKVYKSVIKPLSPGRGNFFKNMFQLILIISEIAKIAYANESSPTTSERILSKAAKNIKSLTTSSHDLSSSELVPSSGD